MSFPLIFPLTFISAAFVPVHTMPSWLQGFATYQPFSVTVSACRSLMVGAAATNTGRSTEFWVVQSLIWSVVLLAIFIPLAIRRYRTRT